MKPLSSRVHHIRPSGIRRIFDLACANPDGLDLSIGDPDYDVPAAVKEEAIRAIQGGFNRYVSTRGDSDLRARLKQKLRQRKIHFEDILITSGATGAYYLAVMTVAGPGDEVLILDPYFVAYANVVIMCGAEPVLVNTYPDFHIREEELVSRISAKTKAIVINHPGNPTGVVYGPEELELVAQVAEQHGLYVISDEVYDQFVYTNEPFVSLGNVCKNAIVISGFSKTSGMTGWRLGYVSASAEVIDAMATFQQYSYVCANSVAQKAAVTALETDMSSEIRRYKARRDFVFEQLQDRFSFRRPEGAFYFFPQAPGGDAERFVNEAIAHKLFIIPGNVFSERNSHFRLSIAVDEDKLARAVDILKRLAARSIT